MPDPLKFREKLERELKAGTLSLVLLSGIQRLGPVHGYRLLQAVSTASDGALDVREGTAYPLLQNLERMGLVRTHWGEGTGGPPRKYYELTPAGKAALRGGIQDWRALTEAVGALLDAPRWEEST